MSRSFIAAWIVIAVASPSWAADPTAVCAAMASAMERTAQPVATIYGSLANTNLAPDRVSELGDDASKALHDLEASKQALIGPMKDFMEKLQDASYALQKCAR